MQEWLELENLVLQLNKLKKRNHMFILIDGEGNVLKLNT